MIFEHQTGGSPATTRTMSNILLLNSHNQLTLFKTVIDGYCLVIMNKLEKFLTRTIKYLAPRFYDYLAELYYRKIKTKTIIIKNPNHEAQLIEGVKTIWNAEYSINLKDFYYPSTITYKNTVYPVIDLDMFDTDKRIVIEGTTGQGKSILLRYLVGQELRKGYKIPIFCELKNICKDKTLEDLVLSSLSSLGITLEKTFIKRLLGENRTSLILDAFDEVDEQFVKRTLDEISNYSTIKTLKIIVTSRKKHEIQKLNKFVVAGINIISKPEVAPFLNKLFENEENLADEIVSSINKSNPELFEIAYSPLLLTLLAIIYKINRSLPNSLIDFYDGLFELLVMRHDRTKPNLRRVFKTELSEKELEKVFMGFCFLAISKQIKSFGSLEADKMLAHIRRYYSELNIDSDCFIQDIVVNTNLFLSEGNRYVFLHRSIIEFHAAKFIKTAPLKLKMQFYESCRNNKDTKINKPILFFLESIDMEDYQTNLIAPEILEIFDRLVIEFDYDKQRIDLNWVKDIKLYCPSRGNWNCDFEFTPIKNGDSYGLTNFIENFFQDRIRADKIQFKGRGIKDGVGDNYYLFGEEVTELIMADCTNYEDVVSDLQNELIPWLNKERDRATEILEKSKAHSSILEESGHLK
jgi:hypothetical protein